MKLEEGMYVRTKYNGISKIVDYINDQTHYFFKCYKLDRDYINCEEYITEIDVLKTSHNIIDLIEVEDYVNGSKVININYDLNYDEDIVESITIFDYSIEGNDILHNEEIKSIVTKEQFESISYEVK